MASKSHILGGHILTDGLQGIHVTISDLLGGHADSILVQVFCHLSILLHITGDVKTQHGGQHHGLGDAELLGLRAGVAQVTLAELDPGRKLKSKIGR